MDEKSKSQKKREAHMLQQLGLNIAGLKKEELEKLPLPNQLKEAILAYRNMTSHGAKRRQAQLIGKFMRNTDETLKTAYEQLWLRANSKPLNSTKQNGGEPN